MVNEFPIRSFADPVYWHAVLNCYVKYADVSAGDMAEIWTDKRGYLGTFKIAQVSRQIDNAKIVFEGTKPWDALYGNQASPVPAASQTGTLKIVQKNTLRPKFERYFDEYATPIFTSLYTTARNNSGKTILDMPQGFIFPKNVRAEIISSTGKYSGVHFPIKSQQWADMRGVIELHFDIPYNGDDSGIVVYTEGPNVQPVVYDKPYIDTTQVLQTIVNPTNAAITVNSETSSGIKYTQVVQPGETQVLKAQPEPTVAPPMVVPPLAPPFVPIVVLKSATIPPTVPVSPATPPVIEPVNPNPGATSTENGNPGAIAQLPPTTVMAPPMTVTAPAITVAAPVPPKVTIVPPDVAKAGILENPVTQLVLAALAIFLVVKIVKKA